MKQAWRVARSSNDPGNNRLSKCDGGRNQIACITTQAGQKINCQSPKMGLALANESHRRLYASRLLGTTPGCRTTTESLVREAVSASWTQPADIKAWYRSASVLKNRRVVFNIKGNDYRLIVAIAYKLQIVYVKFVGTHKEYDAVDAETVDKT